MSKNLLPNKWTTERVRVEDSTLDEVEELQRIYDAVPQTQGWTRVKAEGEPEYPMLSALKEGVLPPNGSKECFRLQSIRMMDTEELIGFLGVYHGFPREGIFWINTLTLHPRFQGKGFGQELTIGLSNTVRQLESYTQIRTFVNLKNWPSLRLCVKVGLDRMVVITGDKRHSDKAEGHVMLEKIIAASQGRDAPSDESLHMVNR